MKMHLEETRTGSSLFADLAKIIEVMLDKQSSPYELREASWNLYYLCSGVTGINEHSQDTEEVNPVKLKTGLAISPVDAAKQVRDFTRTVMFMRGCYEGILEAQNRFPGEKIQILYAGCSPFIPYVLGMSALFSFKQIEFVLVSAHQKCLDSAIRLSEEFNIRKIVKDCALSDPAKYKIFPVSRPHILLIDCMNRALSYEQQAAITLNLAPCLRQNGILIPEEITLTACMANPDKEFRFFHKDERIDLQTLSTEFRIRKNPAEVFKMSLKNLPQVNVITTKSKIHLKPSSVYAADIPISGNYKLMICTKVKTFGNNLLNDYDSGITMPYIHNILPAEEKKYIEFAYRISSDPGLSYRFISKNKYRLKNWIKKF